jgi:hypothetical protein
VYIGSGIGSLDDVYDTTVSFEKGVSTPRSVSSSFASFTDGIDRDTRKFHRSSCLVC